MSLSSLLDEWRRDPQTAANLATWRILPPRPATALPFPTDLPATVKQALISAGVSALYSHQVEAWQAARAGKHIVLATGTASGKTLAYTLPILATLLTDPEARALYIFPTKALAQDQLATLHKQLTAMGQQTALPAAIYDGDTPAGRRAPLRQRARILLTNPDMLHTGILPHHPRWEEFFRHLKFIVIDEMHVYRGVFGSHVANVVRRLKRIAAFYGAQPQFILTSATIGNPAQLAGRLIEAPVHLIDHDGSARGERHFLLYNPPIVEETLGLRKSAYEEALRLATALLKHNVQTVIFARARRSVEMLLTRLQAEKQHPPAAIRGYRSGYLPAQRREIENGLRHGSVRLVVATNALELGIDIGSLGAAMLVSYPGSIASLWQQAGRAGRGEAPALSILIASSNPLDQFLAHHPEYLFGQSPEHALINPNHLLILLTHLRCALFELPFQKGEPFGDLPAEQVEEFLQILLVNQEAHLSQDTYFWMADQYPAASISLRSASPVNVLLRSEDENGPHIIGEVDLSSAFWMVHPRAIYLHEGQQYFVQELDLQRNQATLIPVSLDYYTEPLRETTVQIVAIAEQTAVAGGEKGWGDLEVTTQVTGFRKRSWLSGENLGEEPLDLPPTKLQTTGYWLTLSEATVTNLRQTGVWSNDPNDYGPDWPKIRAQVRARDGFRCALCGTPETDRQHDVHHKIPFRQFPSAEQANRLENLITLCPSCHRRAEQNVRMRSGLAGLGYVLSQLAPLFLMCDSSDLGVFMDASGATFNAPAIAIYDQVPAGIGFSQKLFELHGELVERARQLISECPCQNGCPSCVGPAGENGVGGKQETLAILKWL